MSRKSQNATAPLSPQDDLLEALSQEHEHREESRRETLISRVTPSLWERSGHLGWSGSQGDRFKILRERYLKGEIHWKAFKAFVKKFGFGTEAVGRRKDKRYEKLADHLVYKHRHFVEFGSNFPLILEGLELENEDVQAQIEEFVNKKEPSILDENKLVKAIKKAKKESVTSKDVANGIRAELDINGLTETLGEVDEGGSGRSGKRLLKEITTEQKKSIEGQPPEEAVHEMHEAALATKKNYEEALKAANNVTELIKLLTSDKKALKEQLKNPEYVKEILKTLLENEALLKRVSRISNNQQIRIALKALQRDRKSYAENLEPENIGEDQTIQAKFIKSEESKLSVKRLEKAVNENLEPFFEAVLVAETEEALDTLRDDKEEAKQTITETDVERKILEVSQKLNVDLKELNKDDKGTVSKLSQALNESVPLQNNLKSSLKEIVKAREPLTRFAKQASLRAGPSASIARRLEEEIGVKLFEQDEEGGLYVAVGRKIRLIKPSEENASSSKPLDRIRKDKKGTAIQESEIVEIVDNGKPWDDVDEEDQAFMDEREPLHKGTKWPGNIRIAIKRQNGKIEEHSSLTLIKEFLPYVAAEVVDDKKVTEKRAREVIGQEVRIAPGEMFLLSSQTEEGSRNNLPSELDVIEIVSINENESTIKFNKKFLSQREKEIPSESVIRNEIVTDEFTYGEFLSFLLRRKGQVHPMSEASDVEELKKEGLRVTGKMGDNPLLMSRVAQDLTPRQLETLKNMPVVSKRIRLKDSRTGRPHWVQMQGPSTTMKMSDQDKFANLLSQAQANSAGQGQGDDEHSEESQESKAASQEALKALKSHHDHTEEEGSGPPPDRDDIESLDVIPYDAARNSVNAGDATLAEESYFSGLWKRTRILACDDFGGLFKHMYEYYERHWHRRSKDKFSRVGEGLPYWGTEMGRIKQEAENEEVHQFTQAMEKWSELQVHHTMLKTHNKDQLKACMEVLVKKGQLRWDDVDFWHNLNHFIPFNLQIPLPGNSDPYLKNKLTGRTGFEYLQPAIDYLWGEGTYNEWYAGNASTYDSNLKKYFEQGKFSEGDIKNNKSIDGELAELLGRHKKGGYVDPQQYEGLLHFIIDAGKGSGMETKLYYMIEGIAAKNPVTGRTIMSLERLGAINGAFLNRFPLMDYITRRDVPRTADGKVRSSWTIHDYESWCRDWDAAGQAEGKANKPSSRVSYYLWNYVLTDEKTITRTNKGLRKAQDMDHDDSYGIIPLADKEEVDTITRQTSGSVPMFTWEGYANAYPGYNEFWKVLGQRGDKAKLAKSIIAYTRYDAILTKRWMKDTTTYARLDDSFFNRPSVVDTRPTGWHQTQLAQVIKSVAHAYGDNDLINIVNTMYIKTGSTQDTTEAARQKEVQKSLESFDKKFMDVIKTDGGEKLIQVVNSAQLTGMGDISTEERVRRKKMFEMENDELTQTFGDYKRDAA